MGEWLERLRAEKIILDFDPIAHQFKESLKGETNNQQSQVDEQFRINNSLIFI